MRNIHPFQGMGTNHGDSLRFWDDYAEMYSSMQQGDIPKRIIARLIDMDLIGDSSTVLELGSGPGTYSLPLARTVSSVTCMDTSPKMLDRLVTSASSENIRNITPLLSDWTVFSPTTRYSVCMSSLCPGTGSPESLQKMESISKDGCVMVSWLENHGDDLTSDIWHELGKEYGFDFRKNNPALEWLKDNGRKPIYEIFETHITAEFRLNDLIEKERAAFRAYGIETDIEPIVRKLVDSDNGIVHYNATNRMKLIVWRH